MPIKQLPRIRPQQLELEVIYDLTGGLNDNANQVTLQDNELSDGKNMKLGADSLWTGRGGIYRYGNLVKGNSDILGLFEFQKASDGTTKQIATAGTDIFVYASGEWAAQGEATTAANKAEMINSKSTAYWCNGQDDMKKYDGSSWTTMGDFPVGTAGVDDQPHGLEYFKERIIAWNTDNQPQRIYYSDQSAETTTATNYFDINEPVVACVELADSFLLTFSETKVYRTDYFIFTGTTYDPDKLKRLIVGEGTRAQRSVKRIGNLIYYIGRDGIMVTDGTVSKNISKTRLGTLWGTLNQNYLSNACAGIDGDNYVLSVSTSGTVNDVIITYDTVKDIFYVKWDNVNISCFENFTTSGIKSLYGGDDSGVGQVFSFNNTNIYDEGVDTEYVSETVQDGDNNLASGTTTRVAQSFKLSEDLNILAVEALLKKVSGTTTELTVRIETDSSSKPSGTLANTSATTTITAFTGTSYLWKKAEFTTPFYLNASTTYWLVIQHTTEGAGDSIYAWGSDDSSPTYTNGNIATYASSAWTADADKDALFRVIHKDAYDKYITTKGYYLSDPQKTKKVKNVYVEADSSGDWNVTIGLKSDLYDSYNENFVNLSGNAPIRGSVVRGNFIRGTQQIVQEFIEPDDFRARMVKIRAYNNRIEENFKIRGMEINYQTINLLR